MRQVGVLEAKTQLSALVDSVERGGEDVVITRHGRPVARITTAAVAQEQPPRLSGPELAARFRRLREQIARENPEIENLTWEEILAMRDA